MLGHPIKHAAGDPVLDCVAPKEPFEIVDDDLRHFTADLPEATGHVRGKDRTRQLAHRMAEWQRFVGVSNVEGATQSSAPYFVGEGIEIDDAAPCNVNDGRAVGQA